MTSSTHALPGKKTPFAATGTIRFMLQRPGMAMAIAWLSLFLLVALCAPVIAPFDPVAIALDARLLPPAFLGGTWHHLLGTDDLGRDILSRLIYSVQISAMVATCGALISTTLGTLLGAIAAEVGGFIDECFMVIVDMQAALPFMITVLLIITVFGNSVGLFIFIVGLYGWERHARVVRGVALTARNRLYVTAARTYGASLGRIYIRHVLPLCLPTIVAGMTVALTEMILLESTLSFLGLGIQPPMSSLGNMVGLGRDQLMSAWWIPVFPGIVIAATTLSLMTITDFMRDRRPLQTTVRT